jgi:integrase
MPTYKGEDGRWRYRFFTNGRRYSGSAPKGGNTKRIAEAVEAEHIKRVSLNVYDGKMPTVREFAARFLAFQAAKTKPLTLVQQKATVEQHLIPAYGSRRLDLLDDAAIDALIAKWGSGAKPNKPKTINTRLGTIRRMLVMARKWKIIGEVPKFEFVTVNEAAPKYLTDAEVTKLIEAAEPRWRLMLFVGVRTGLRVGELRGLQWGDMDFAARVVNVNRTDPGRRTMDATAPKSNRHRQVPLTNDTLALLIEARPDDASPTDWVWPALLKRGGEERARCRSEKGCWHAVSRAAKLAGLTGVAWHTLRHTYASHLVMRGVPIRHIQKWLGHASVKETEKYAHLSPDAGHDAANLLDVPLAPDRYRQGAAKSLLAGGRKRNDSAELPADT